MIQLLIAEDEVIERKALKKMLTDKLPEADIIGEAANGREVIRMAKELAPDIMLMDVKMPGIDGIEAIKTIRRSSPAMKFIIVSAYDTFEYAREAMREGVRDYLLKPAKKAEIIHIVSRLIREVKAEQAGSTAAGQQDMTEIGLLAEAKAKAYIEAHYTEHMTLEDAAAYVGLSPYYFSKLFKQTYGETFVHFLTDLRINKAQELLKTTHLSQKEICYTIGYHDPNYFSRVFKKNTGYTPRAFRAATQFSP